MKKKYGIGIGGISECESTWMWEDDDESWKLEPTPLISAFVITASSVSSVPSPECLFFPILVLREQRRLCSGSLYILSFN